MGRKKVKITVIVSELHGKRQKKDAHTIQDWDENIPLEKILAYSMEAIRVIDL